MTGLSIHTATSAADLAPRLAAALSGSRSDALAADVICVPTTSLQRWLTQQLARAGSGQGICAGVDFLSFPALQARVRGLVDDEPDPWAPNSLVWTLLAVLEEAPDDPALALLNRHLAASRQRFGPALRIAHLFARYAEWRPELIDAWARGENGPATDVDAWQPRLWRLAVAQLGVNPLARIDEELAALASGPSRLALPGRLDVFAPLRLSPRQARLLEALAADRAVNLWLVRSSGGQRQPHHVLNQRLGRDDRALAATLPSDPLSTPGAPRATTVLGWLQSDIESDRSTPPPRTADPSDRSVQFHAAHGLDRQVEVLREVVTGLMAADPTLEPRDIVVGCADLTSAAPLINAAFTFPPELKDRHPASAFRVEVSDRTAADINPLVEILLRLLRLPTSRVDLAELLDFCAQPAVAARFGLRPEDAERISDLAERSGIRWGLSPGHRAQFGLGGFRQNTWISGLQRLLLGIALTEDDLTAAKTTLPFDDIESSDVQLLGGLSELISRLNRLIGLFEEPAPIAEWMDRARTAIEWTTAVSGDDSWQQPHLLLGLSAIADRGGRALLNASDVISVLTDRFLSTPARPTFGNGSLSVCSLASLRLIPHRVICLVGLDDGAFPHPPSRDGDDLLLRDPHPTDPHPSATDRQILLDAIMSASQTLVLIYQGRSQTTNEVVVPPAPVLDLIEAIDGTATAPSGEPLSSWLTTQHPLQPFDPRYFRGNPTSFDTAALHGAGALTGPRRDRPDPRAPLAEPEPDREVSLGDLSAFFTHPAKYYLRKRTGLSLFTAQAASAEIPIEPDTLERWKIGERMLDLARSGHDASLVTRAEWLRGAVPPGQLGVRLLEELKSEVGEVTRWLPDAARGSSEVDDISIDLDGVRLSGRLHAFDGQLVSTEYSNLQPKHRLAAWIRVLALAAATDRPSTALVLTKRARTRLRSGSPMQARAILRGLLAIYAAGLRSPLPMPVRVAERFASLRASRQDPLEFDGRKLNQQWHFDKDRAWSWFYDDHLHLLSVGRSATDPVAFPEETTLLGALARTVWDDLTQNEERL
ncbi:MAG: exodeoxyribonuclease V subunit gamma [Micropruina sp.]